MKPACIGRLSLMSSAKHGTFRSTIWSDWQWPSVFLLTNCYFRANPSGLAPDDRGISVNVFADCDLSGPRALDRRLCPTNRADCSPGRARSQGASLSDRPYVGGLTPQVDCSHARRRGQRRFNAKPAMTKPAATSFHGGRGSPSSSVEAPMPKMGTSRAKGVIVAVG